MYLLLVNPKAGNKLYRRIERRFVSALTRYKLKYKLVIVDDLANTGELLANNLTDSVKAVVAVGGNGTVASVIDALADRELSLAIIPTSPSNHLAKLLGVKSWQSGIRTLAHHQIKEKRLGKIGQRFFIGDITIAPKRNLIRQIFGRQNKIKRFFGANLPQSPKQQHSVACQIKLDNALEVSGQLARLDIHLTDDGKKRMRIQLHTLADQGVATSVFWANRLEINSSLNMPIISGNETLANTPANIQAIMKTISVFQPARPLKPKRGLPAAAGRGQG